MRRADIAPQNSLFEGDPHLGALERNEAQACVGRKRQAAVVAEAQIFALGDPLSGEDLTPSPIEAAKRASTR